MSIDSTEADLWIAVIKQALSDATLGLGVGREEPTTVGWALMDLEVRRARCFIRGDDGSLCNICDALGMDYEDTKEQLLKVYRSCLPRMPDEWRQEL